MKNIYHLKNLRRQVLLLFVFLMAGLQASAQLVVTPTSTTSPYTPAEQLARMLVGQGVTVSNAQITGLPTAYGKFNGVNTNIGLDSGVLLTSGTILNALGPNTSGSTTGSNGGAAATNVYLNALGQGTTQDATMLEFDLQVAADTLRFQYVFASEEYPEFSCDNVKDVFGFFISGPGVIGNVPGFPAERNIAIIPGTVNTPVGVGTIHPIDPNGGVNCTSPTQTSFIQYYVDNTGGLTVEYDGFTVVLTAEIWGLIPCETYHLRLAIADVGDSSYDSGVFIKAGSLSSSGVVFSATTDVSYAGFNDLLEGCVNGGFAIKRYGDLSQPKTVSFAISGTAINGWDYTDANLMPLDSVYTFAIGQDSMYIEIYPYQDFIPDDYETIIFDLKSTCTDSATGESATLIIRDEIPLELVSSPVLTGPVCAGTPIQLSASGAVDYFWLNNTGLSDDLIPNPILTPTVSGTYVVIGSVLSCQTTDTLEVIVEPEVIGAAGPDFSSCTPGSVQLQGSGGGTYSWTGPGNFTSTQQNPTTSYANPGMYILTVTTPAGCEYTDTTEVITLGPVLSLGPDVQICEGENVQLTTTITENGTTPLTYSFSPAAGLSSTNIGNPVATPAATTTYTVTVTNGANCSNSDVITITVNEVPDISAGADNAICEGGTYTLQGQDNTNAPGTTYTWSNAALLSSANVLSPVATPTTDTEFVLTAANGTCSSTDTVTIQVNLRPVLSADPVAQPICEGESVVLTASETSGVPNVQYSWAPAGTLTGATTRTPTATPNVTTTYYVYADNAGCIEVDSVVVTVDPVPQINAGNNATICEGETYTLQGVDNTGVTGVTYTWNNGSLLSATDILDPVATITQDTDFTLTATYGNCTATSTVNIIVNPLPQFSAGPDIEICPLQPEQLQATDANTLTGVTYSWSPATGLSATDVRAPYAGPAGTVTYTAFATANGCSSAETYVTVSTKPAAVVDAGPDMILCPGAPSVNLQGTATSVLPGITYQWYPAATAATSTELSTDVSPSATTNYILEATVANCKSYDTVQVVVVPDMDLSIAANPTGGQAPLPVLFTPSGNNLVSYAWNFGNANSTTDTSSLMTPTYIYTEQGVFTATLIATDNMGCIDTAMVDVRVSVGVPNIFTPNGDGINDVFNAGVLPANTTLRIFSRWGNIVYESSNYQNNWDGGDSPDGIYFYSISYPDSGESFKGWLEIRR